MKIKGSIRKRLIISLILLAIIPLLLLGILLSWQSFVIQQRQIIELQKEKARRVLHQISSIIHEQDRSLSNALKIDFYILDTDREQQQRFLSELLSFTDENNMAVFDEVALLDSKGRELARESRTSIITSGELRNRSDADEFKAPVSSRQTYYGPVYFDDKTGSPHMLISMPVIDAGNDRVKGVLTADMRLKFMWNLVGKLNVGEAGLVYIVDSDGRVIVHPNPSVVLRKTHFNPHDPGIRTGLDGKKVISTLDTLDLAELHMHVVTEIPLSEALENTYTSLLTITAFLVLTIASSVLLGFVIVRGIIRPVESLAETAHAISEGDINMRSDIAREDELGELSDAFNIMTSRLAETITSLKSEIAERNKIEKSLFESHERLLLVFDSLESIVYVTDFNTYELLFANKLCRDIFGDLIGKVCYEVLQSGQSAPCAFCTNDKLLDAEGNPAGVYTWEFQNTINCRWYYIHDRAIKWVDGRLARLEIATDVTMWKEAESALIKERDLFRTMIEGLPGAFYIFNDKGKFLRWNKTFEAISGYSPEEINALTALDMFAEQDRALVAERIAEVFTKGQSYVEATVLTKTKREIPYLLTGCRCEIDNEPCLIGLGLDISDRKKAENIISSSLREKEILLKEIHHRVKNNMQIITSLLNLQADKIDDKRYVAMFQESRNRIRAMALVHEKLYQSQNLADIDFDDYIKTLANSLFSFYGPRYGHILLKTDASEIKLAIDTAIPCGLIINELVSNVLKYAFPESRNGELQIIFEKIYHNGDVEYHLIVSDNGVGLPEGFDIEALRTLGLQIVKNLVEHQLQGTLEIIKDNGTKFYIRFKELTYKKRV